MIKYKSTLFLMLITFCCEANATDAPLKKHWLSTLLEKRATDFLQTPIISESEILIKSSEIDLNKTKEAWLPSINGRMTSTENRQVSLNITDGRGIVKNSQQGYRVGINKKSKQGLEANFTIEQVDSKSSSANRFSPTSTESIARLTLTKALLKGASVKENTFSNQEAKIYLENLKIKFKGEIVTQMSEIAEVWIQLSEAMKVVDVRKKHLESAKKEMSRAQARVNIKLDAPRVIYTHRRRVLRQSIELKVSEDNVTRFKNELTSRWPEVSIPSELELERIQKEELTLNTHLQIKFNETREGKVWLKTKALSERREDVMKRRSRDDLSFSLTFSSESTAQNAGESWKNFSDLDGRNATVALNYSRILGESASKLNRASAIYQTQVEYQRWRKDKLNWKKKVKDLLLEVHQWNRKFDEQATLLKITKQEIQLAQEELKQGFIRLDELFILQSNLLTTELDLMKLKMQQLRLDLQLRTQNETLYQLLP